MSTEQFAYWLQGFVEMTSAPPTSEQWQVIRQHLAAVFTKVTPPLAMPNIIPTPLPAGTPWCHPAPSSAPQMVPTWFTTTFIQPCGIAAQTYC